MNILNPKTKEIFKTEFEPNKKHHFFGYYDKCPWSKDGRFLLALETDLIDRLPNENDVALVGIIDLKGDKKFKKLTETRAWNFQQGCMLQWLGPDFNERIIFNDFRDGRFVSVIFNTKTEKEEKEIPFPIYAVHPSGEFALSVNFSRLDKLREGYGYKGVSKKIEAVSVNDGIYKIDFLKNNLEIILSLEQLRSHNFISDLIDDGEHWVDHLTFTPAGERFIFLHRVEVKNIGMFSRLYTANNDGSGLFGPILSGMGSHFSWKNNEEFLVWGRPPGVAASIGKHTFLKKIITPIYQHLPIPRIIKLKMSGDGFLLFKDKTKEFITIEQKLLKEDGHASFSPNENWLLGDNYPDKKHYRDLFLYNLKENKKITLNRFYSMPNKEHIKKENWDNWDLTAMRSDFHPRWNREGTQICIDSVHEGSRQMHVFDVADILNENGEN